MRTFSQLKNKIARGLRFMGFSPDAQAVQRFSEDLVERGGIYDAFEAAEWLVYGEVPGEEKRIGLLLHHLLDDYGFDWR